MRNTLLAVPFLVAAAVSTLSTVAADVPLSPRTGVLLLTNGEIIEGTITAAGDHYDVVRGQNEIRLHRSRVALVAGDVQECYQHKRKSVDATRALDYLDLAEWCLRHELYDAAEHELAAARRVDDTHPKLRLLETRLRVARQKPEPRPPAAPAEARPPRESLDAVVKDLPAGTVEGFTNHMQPLLLNYCARAGCHGTQTADTLRLERIAPNRTTGRKSTQRNLQAVLAAIDRANPEQSKLLTVPIRPHGREKRVVFTERQQGQYKQLVEWVYQVAGTAPPQQAPATLADRTSPLLERGPHAHRAARNIYQPGRQAADESGSVQPASHAEPRELSWSDHFPDQRPAVARQAAGSAPNPEIPAAAAAAAREPVVETELEPEKKPATFVPKDPFDPEIFNRRYLDR